MPVHQGIIPARMDGAAGLIPATTPRLRATHHRHPARMGRLLEGHRPEGHRPADHRPVDHRPVDHRRPALRRLKDRRRASNAPRESFVARDKFEAAKMAASNELSVRRAYVYHVVQRPPFQ